MVARNLSLILQKPDRQNQPKLVRNKITVIKDGIIVEVGFIIYKNNNQLKYTFIWYTKISI